jgi:hypothetical protein
MKNEQWEDAWYTIRVLIGIAIQAFMIFCIFALTEHILELMDIVGDRVLKHQVSALTMDIILAVPTIASGMAGMNWVKSQYIRYCLPEVMDDVTKKILKS